MEHMANSKKGGMHIYERLYAHVSRARLQR